MWQSFSVNIISKELTQISCVKRLMQKTRGGDPLIIAAGVDEARDVNSNEN
jgi:hypothetical protein